MLASLLDIPHDQNDWDFVPIGLARLRSERRFQKQYSVTLTHFQIDPMSALDIDTFLQNKLKGPHLLTLNAILGLNGIVYLWM